LLISRVYFLIAALPARLPCHDFDLAIPGNSLGLTYVLWLFLLMLLSFAWEWKVWREMSGQPEQKFHQIACAVLVSALLLLGAIHFPVFGLASRAGKALALALSLMSLPPFVALIYFVQRHNFLNIGRQKNLLYAVSATFVLSSTWRSYAASASGSHPSCRGSHGGCAAVFS